jgi:hypothetical protein
MLKVYGRLKGKRATIQRGAYRVYQQKRERVMNKEYLEAKFDLCIKEAEKDLQQEEIARAIANLRRANSALSQLFGFEEEENE